MYHISEVTYDIETNQIISLGQTDITAIFNNNNNRNDRTYMTNIIRLERSIRECYPELPTQLLEFLVFAIIFILIVATMCLLLNYSIAGHRFFRGAIKVVAAAAASTMKQQPLHLTSTTTTTTTANVLTTKSFPSKNPETPPIFEGPPPFGSIEK